LAEIERGLVAEELDPQDRRVHAGGRFALTAPRRLLTNVLYTGAIRHQGQMYPFSHPGARPVGASAESDPPIGAGAAANCATATRPLLHGLLHCECCSARMIYSYYA
jgi:hypothetical protein